MIDLRTFDIIFHRNCIMTDIAPTIPRKYNHATANHQSRGNGKLAELRMCKREALSEYERAIISYVINA
jgi:hypothetical protein